MSETLVVILDNYDSFAFNLYQAVGEITGSAPLVIRNDAVLASEVAALGPTHVIVSPGPGDPRRPEYFGVCREVIVQLGAEVPVLGVCLGHQGIAAAFGGGIVRSPTPTHGKTSLIVHDGQGVFKDIASPLEAMRYHSLAVCKDQIPRRADRDGDDSRRSRDGPAASRPSDSRGAVSPRVDRHAGRSADHRQLPLDGCSRWGGSDARTARRATCLAPN